MKNVLHWLTCGLFAVAMSTTADASVGYPDRVVRIVVPYPAGGGVDVMARQLSNRLAQRWGQPVIVENRPGAGTNIGASAVAKASPDGYMLLLTTDTTVTTNPHLFRQLPFDPMKDLVPIAHLVNLNHILVVNPTVLARTLSELLAIAKSKKEPLNFSSAGNGSQAHLMFQALNYIAGLEIAHIPYSGIAPALQAVVSGEVQMTLAGATSIDFIQSGRLRALAVSGEKRNSALPDIPTLREVGLPEVDPRGWVGLFAPAGLPSELAKKIESDVLAVLADPEFRRTAILNIAYSVPFNSGSEAFKQFLQQDFAFKKRMIETAQVRLN